MYVKELEYNLKISTHKLIRIYKMQMSNYTTFTNLLLKHKKSELDLLLLSYRVIDQSE